MTAAWHVKGCSARASLLVTNWHMIVCDLGEGVTYIYIYIYIYIIIYILYNYSDYILHPHDQDFDFGALRLPHTL